MLLAVGLPLLAVGSPAPAWADPPAPCDPPRAMPLNPAGRPPSGPLVSSVTAIPPSPACADPGAVVTRSLHDPAADATHALTVPDLSQVIPLHGGE